MANVYVRLKVEGKGWRFTKVPSGAGKPPEWLQAAKKDALNGGRGFQHRLADGNWSQQFKTIDEAKAAANGNGAPSVSPSGESPDTELGKPLRTAIEEYLDHKRINQSSISKYTFTLNEFMTALPRSIRFVGQAKNALRTYLRWLEAKGAAPKTINDKILTVCFMLKHAGVVTPSKLVELPTVEDEKADPYSDEDLAKIFRSMDAESRLVFDFFLLTACREKEVAHAQYADINWKTGEFNVRSKTWKAPNGLAQSFTVKSHQSRTVPLTRELLDALKKRQKSATTPWIFPNTEGQPEGHFLRKFKKTAADAGANCGTCFSAAGKSCSDRREGCEKHYLHRLRSTRITFWLHQGLDIKTVMDWAGHKKMETTQVYAGSRETAKVQEEINRPMF